MILEGGISKNYTQNWDKNGNIYYTDENGQVVDFKVNPFVKLSNKVKATATNIGDWINETDPNSEAYKQKVSAIVGLETLPLGLGRFATQQIAKGLTPYVGRKIAQNMAQGIGSGVAGGGIAGGLEAGLNDRNIAIGGLQGATVGGLLGGLGGYGLGKVAQKFERAKLPNNTVAQEQYFNDYVADLNNKTKAMADFRAGKLGMNNGKMQLAYDLADDEAPLTETQAFKNWFGNSKVVDENGNPLVVYHGTNADFDTFDKSKIGSVTDAGYAGQGFYGHIDKDTAKVYGKNVMPLYLKAENIYDFNNGKSIYDNYRSMGIEPDNMYDPYYDPPEVRDANISKAVTKWLKDNNYDGAKLWGQYMVLEPEQIKSVNNQGTFDPTNPNIYKSILAPIGAGALVERLLNKEYNERNSY